MIPLGTQAPNFRLPETDGGIVARDDFADAPALLVAFICTHCPFVRHLSAGLASFGREFIPRGVAIVAINSNDEARVPEDSFEAMVREKARVGYPFPYAHDASQQVARSYGAVCTPDFFLFDGERELVYRGQFDDSRPGNGKSVSGEDLRIAATAVLTGKDIDIPQRPSVGCSIKWKR
ncbi:MAG: thioredoxin family protein [Ectothiorhodospiraceae bacterium]|nr:thioredoxin family protein [Ectothiorhodospiraceae bacterium]